MTSVGEMLGRKEVLISIMLIVASITFSNYMFIDPTLKITADELTAWGSTITLFTVLLGAISTLKYHAFKVSKKDKDSTWSAWLIFCFATMYLIGLVWGTLSDAYEWLITYILVPLGTTTSSLLGLFMISASYRAFKVRNLDSALLLSTAVIIMIGRNIPLGATISKSLPAIGTWLLDFPNTGANRGITFVMAIVAMGYSLRILIGRERGA
jgi:hypothetical protein